ncbi:MAG: RNA polymerase Rpb6 [Bacteroidales bacterium]|jgi:bacterioferritin (cytochrome b1)|nr:RNA polymerase Rpb6 [Bacteroidales bacterium]
MDFNKIKINTNIQTHDLNNFSEMTGNLYETIAMLSKRSDQISVEIKRELMSRIEEFNSGGDNLEEMFDNHEQIEIARYFEQLPKPCLIAINEYLNKQLVYRNEEEVIKDSEK